jgi:hypothetical protein
VAASRARELFLRTKKYRYKDTTTPPHQTTSSRRIEIMGNAVTNPTAKAHAQSLDWSEESVPDDAWVVSVWLEVN